MRIRAVISDQNITLTSCWRHFGGFASVEVSPRLGGVFGGGLSVMTKRITGGCLCGALRYEAEGEPLYAGHCYCADCRKASGSGFSPFMGYPSSAVRFSGASRTTVTKAFRGGEAVRNFCPVCSSLVFGGRIGEDASHTLYAGSLDDPSLFKPQIAIFARDRPDWALIPEGLTVFETMPDEG
jgi:hypothetical protein